MYIDMLMSPNRIVDLSICLFINMKLKTGIIMKPLNCPPPLPLLIKFVYLFIYIFTYLLTYLLKFQSSRLRKQLLTSTQRRRNDNKRFQNMEMRKYFLEMSVYRITKISSQYGKYKNPTKINVK